MRGYLLSKEYPTELKGESIESKIKKWQQPMEQLDENGEPVLIPTAELEALGVTYEYIDPSADDLEHKLDTFCERYGYKNRDEVNIQMPTDPTSRQLYFDKLDMFHTEHIHADDEVRYLKAGSGYFDIRSKEDDWIRLHLTAGDLILLPAGIYHRFICDAANRVHAVRLFRQDPQWTAINRFSDGQQQENLGMVGIKARQQYLRQIAIEQEMPTSNVNSN